MFLSIIVPCYNEEQTIRLILKRLYSAGISTDFEVILVDDGSEIPLESIVGDMPKKYDNLYLYRLPTNMGKGYAVRYGIARSRGDYILIQDADMEYDPYDIPKLLAPVMQKKAKVVYGTRFGRKNNKINMSALHLLGNLFLTFWTNLLFGTKLTDMETGYKLFPRRIGKMLGENVKSFELEPIITVIIIKNGLKIEEVPIKYRSRIKGVAKINPGDGVSAFLILFILRFFPNSRIFGKIYNFCCNYIVPIIARISSLFGRYKGKRSL